MQIEMHTLIKNILHKGCCQRLMSTLQGSIREWWPMEGTMLLHRSRSSPGLVNPALTMRQVLSLCLLHQHSQSFQERLQSSSVRVSDRDR